MNQLNQFVLNGQKYATSADLTISDVINYFGYNRALLVVEYNHFICNQTQWNTISIQDNDEIEIVTPSWIKLHKVEKIYKTTINHWTKKAWTKFSESFWFDKSCSNEVNEAHWWWYEVWINMKENPWKFSIIRKNN